MPLTVRLSTIIFILLPTFGFTQSDTTAIDLKLQMYNDEVKESGAIYCTGVVVGMIGAMVYGTANSKDSDSPRRGKQEAIGTTLMLFGGGAITIGIGKHIHAQRHLKK